MICAQSTYVNREYPGKVSKRRVGAPQNSKANAGLEPTLKGKLQLSRAGAAHREAVHPDGRHANAHRNALPFFSASSHPGIKLQVVTD